MTRIARKEVKTFSMKTETLEDLREVAEETKCIGGMSYIVEDAVASWIKRYRENPKRWLAARCVPVAGEPTDDI